MQNFGNAESYQSSGTPRTPRWRAGILLGIALLSMSFVGCQTPREYDCGEAEVALRGYAYEYNRCLEDKGNLRQSLKACQERR